MYRPTAPTCASATLVRTSVLTARHRNRLDPRIREDDVWGECSVGLREPMRVLVLNRDPVQPVIYIRCEKQRAISGYLNPGWYAAGRHAWAGGEADG